jgi:hypothetical protein
MVIPADLARNTAPQERSGATGSGEPGTFDPKCNASKCRAEAREVCPTGALFLAEDFAEVDVAGADCGEPARRQRD